MSCEPKFADQLDWVCIKDIIADVRGGSVSLATVKKGVWVAGCAMELFDGAGPGVFSDHAEADRSLESLCDELEAKLPSSVLSEPGAKIDLPTIIMIVQLVWKLIQGLK